METLFGLPAHPLLVHAAVVLVPLAALGVVLIAFWPAARRHLSIAVMVLALLGFVSAFLAQESGEPLEETTQRSELLEDHTELGETGTMAAGLVLLGALGVGGLDLFLRRRARSDAGSPSWARGATLATGIVASLLVVGGTAQIARIGHSGAKAVWEDVSENSD